MSTVDKSTWLLLEETEKASLVENLLNELESNKLEEKRAAKKKLLTIIGWLDESAE